MVRLIMGANGAGKTKQLIELIHAAVESENGSVVYRAQRRHDLRHQLQCASGQRR